MEEKIKQLHNLYATNPKEQTLKEFRDAKKRKDNLSYRDYNITTMNTMTSSANT